MIQIPEMWSCWGFKRQPAEPWRWIFDGCELQLLWPLGLSSRSLDDGWACPGRSVCPQQSCSASLAAQTIDAACLLGHRLPSAKRGWFTPNTNSFFSLQPPSCAPPPPPLTSPALVFFFFPRLERRSDDCPDSWGEGGNVNHIRESVSGTSQKLLWGRGGLLRGICVCVHVCLQVPSKI